MFAIQVKVTGAKQAAAAIPTQPKVVKRISDGMMTGARQILQERLYGMRNYPPPTFTITNYVRTGKLGSGWGVRKNARAMTITFYNRVKYAPYVVGDEQAWMHQGYWWVASQRVAASVDTISAQIETSIRAL